MHFAFFEFLLLPCTQRCSASPILLQCLAYWIFSNLWFSHADLYVCCHRHCRRRQLHWRWIIVRFWVQRNYTQGTIRFGKGNNFPARKDVGKPMKNTRSKTVFLCRWACHTKFMNAKRNANKSVERVCNNGVELFRVDILQITGNRVPSKNRCGSATI